MKKKLFIVLLTFLSTVCLAFGLAACNQSGGSGGGESAHTHEYGTLIAEKPATCAETGVKAHFYCAGCKKYFDEEKNEVTEQALTIPLNTSAHELKEGESECSVCGTPLTQGLQFTLMDSGAYSVGKGSTTDSEIIIPRKYNGALVTAIDEDAFRDYAALEKITIPDSITAVGKNAFWGCENLMGVYITDIGAWCNIDFAADNIPAASNPLVYANWLYLNNELVKELVIPQGVTEVKDYVFEFCMSITSIAISDSVTSVGTYSFFACTQVKSITFGENSQLSAIGELAFGCLNFENIAIPDSVTSIGESAFYCCQRLTSIIIPNNVTTIGMDAFEACLNLKSITIGKSVTSIGRQAFGYGMDYSCFALIEVINLSQLPIVKGDHSYDSFGGVATYALNVVNSAEESKIKELDGYIFYEDGNTVYLLGYDGEDTELQLPDKFNGKDYEIYQYAFYNNTEITSITIPASVTSIGSKAFNGCCKLAKIINLSQLPIAKGDHYSYGGVAGYAIDVVNSAEESKIVELDGYNFYEDGNTVYLLGYDGEDTELQLPDKFNGKDYKIYQYAFYNNLNITAVTIPASVIDIGKNAFASCLNLKNITFKDNSRLTSIGERAFSGCKSLESITIPANVTSLYIRAFSGCKSLKTVTFENTTGWQVMEGYDNTDVTVTDPEQNAILLKNTYYYNWRRIEE